MPETSRRPVAIESLLTEDGRLVESALMAADLCALGRYGEHMGLALQIILLERDR